MVFCGLVVEYFVELVCWCWNWLLDIVIDILEVILDYGNECFEIWFEGVYLCFENVLLVIVCMLFEMDDVESV